MSCAYRDGRGCCWLLLLLLLLRIVAPVTSTTADDPPLSLEVIPLLLLLVAVVVDWFRRRDWNIESIMMASSNIVCLWLINIYCSSATAQSSIRLLRPWLVLFMQQISWFLSGDWLSREWRHESWVKSIHHSPPTLTNSSVAWYDNNEAGHRRLYLYQSSE